MFPSGFFWRMNMFSEEINRLDEEIDGLEYLISLEDHILMVNDDESIIVLDDLEWWVECLDEEIEWRFPAADFRAYDELALKINDVLKGRAPFKALEDIVKITKILRG